MLNYCTKCGKIAERRHILCRDCFHGALGKYRCPKCNTIIDYDRSICVYCGEDLDDSNKAL